MEFWLEFEVCGRRAGPRVGVIGEYGGWTGEEERGERESLFVRARSFGGVAAAAVGPTPAVFVVDVVGVVVLRVRAGILWGRGKVEAGDGGRQEDEKAL